MQACITAARYGKKGPEIPKCGRQTDPGPPRTQTGGEPQLYLGSKKPAWKERTKEGGEGGSERGDKMKLMGGKSGRC